MLYTNYTNNNNHMNYINYNHYHNNMNYNTKITMVKINNQELLKLIANKISILLLLL